MKTVTPMSNIPSIKELTTAITALNVPPATNASTTFVVDTRLALRLTPIVHPGNTVIPTTSASRRASLTMTVLWGIIVIIMPVRLVLHADRMKGVRVGNTVMHRISAFTTITPVPPIRIVHLAKAGLVATAVFALAL